LFIEEKNMYFFKADMMAALATQKPNLTEKDLVKYQKFTEEYGQDGA
jgi:hypothetical protein